MKRKYLFIILALLSVFTAELTACAEKPEEKGMAETSAAVNNYVPQASDRTVTGEVISVIENEVTLAVGTISEEKPERPSMPEGEMPDFDGKEPPEFNGEKPDFSGERPDFNGEKPDFGGKEMPDFNGEKPDFNDDMPPMPEGADFPSDGERPSGGRRKSSKTVEKTGAEESYIIPVGMTINGLSGRNTDYKGITSGMVLTLTVNSEGVVCAASAE